MRDILILPDKRLRLVSKPVAKIDAATQQARRGHVRDHVRRARHRARGDPDRRAQAHRHHGPRQEGRAERAAGVHQPGADLRRPDEKNIHEEGCLSIPEYYEEVERPAAVKVRYLDLDGKQHEIEADGLLATCIQHEIDHLNGVLFIDHISKLKRDRVIKKFTKAAKLGKRRGERAAE